MILMADGTLHQLYVGGKYRLGKKIGSSSFGKHCQPSLSSKHWLTPLAPGNIYLGISIISGEVGIKLKSMKPSTPTLSMSPKCTKLSLAVLLSNGSAWNAMIMDILGPSLEDLFNFCNCKFSLKIILPLADQLVSPGMQLVFISVLILISCHFP